MGDQNNTQVMALVLGHLFSVTLSNINSPYFKDWPIANLSVIKYRIITIYFQVKC